MLEHTLQHSAGESSPGAMPRADPMAMCPMAKMCGRMMDKPLSRSFLMLPGALLILLGVFIFLEPRTVVWVAGAVAVLLGITLLIMARFMGRMRNR